METDLKDAVKTAQAFALDVFGQEVLDGLRLEEIEASVDETKWLVTLSWLPKAAEPAAGAGLFLQGVRARIYKQFIIDDLDNEVLAVKTRIGV